VVEQDPARDPKILELTALYEISKTLAFSSDLRVTCERILEILATVLGMQRGTLTLLNPDTGELAIQVAHGLTSEQVARGRFRIGEGITGEVLASGEPIVVPDILKEPRFLNRTQARAEAGEGVTIGFIAVPVRVRGETIGVLSVDRLMEGRTAPLEEDLRLLTIVSSLVGQAVKLSQRFELERQSLIEANYNLQQQLQSRYHLKNIVGRSKPMLQVYESVMRVSRSKATVLLRGESGTGKELVARAIHYNSPRADKPFIKVNCASLPETLLESELFGHEKGSFTGATALRPGRFELAHGGTIFLDEIGDISLSIQAKLLRVLQEMQFERVGGAKTLEVDVRVIAATNRDLESAMRERTFREDLYYRLNVVPIFMPPLRDRKEDLPLLMDYFLKKFCDENQKKLRLSVEVQELLTQYHWPGNVRELENSIERLVVMAGDETVTVEEVRRMGLFLPVLEATVGEERPKIQTPPAPPTLPSSLEQMEREQIKTALEKCGGVQAKAARLLGLTARQIAYKIKKYHLQPARL
jgi:Nif-specific regulatory protein